MVGSHAAQVATSDYDDLRVKLTQIYSNDNEAERGVLRVLADAIRLAHAQSPERCWTLTRPGGAVLRLNIHIGTASPKEAVIIHWNGSVELVVDRQSLDDATRDAISRLDDGIIIGEWRSTGAKGPSDRDKIIVPLGQIHCSGEISRLISPSLGAMIRKYAKGRITKKYQDYHRSEAIAYLRDVLGDPDIPDWDSPKPPSLPQQGRLFAPGSNSSKGAQGGVGNEVPTDPPFTPLGEPEANQGSDRSPRIVIARTQSIKYERANMHHQHTLALVRRTLMAKGIGPIEATKYIDAFCTVRHAPAIFEIKSITDANELAQCRRAVSQLYEYRFRYQHPNASLWIVFSRIPTIKWLVRYLHDDRGIQVLWRENDRLVGPSLPILDGKD